MAVTNFNPYLGNTTNKFGVPIPGAQDQSIPVLMPKLKNRFRVRFFGAQFSGTPGNALDLTGQVATAGRPQRAFNNTPLHAYNNIIYIAQKPEWQPIEITIHANNYEC